MEQHGISPESAANFRMIEIAEKKDTRRRAVASGRFFAAPDTLARIRERTLPKGDVLVLAEIAGIQGAKNTSNLLPLCHPLPLTSVRVWTTATDTSITVFCEASTVGKTGVEMEALAGASAALLCIYDLTKGIDPVLGIGDIRLDLKEGGKSGLWKHPGDSRLEQASPTAKSTPVLPGVRAAVLVLSDRCSRGQAEDRSGPAAVEWLEANEAIVSAPRVLPDESSQLRSELTRLIDSNSVNLILTSGGTGLSARDITPETILALSKELNGREIPGFGEWLRQSGLKHTKAAILSRSVAVMIKQTMIIALPGSPKAVTQGLEAVGQMIAHALHIANGGDHK